VISFGKSNDMLICQGSSYATKLLIFSASSSVFNVINILRAAFVPIFFYKKITKPNCKREKLRKALLYKKAA